MAAARAQAERERKRTPPPRANGGGNGWTDELNNKRQDWNRRPSTMSDRRCLSPGQWARPGENERDLRKTNGELCCRREIVYKKRETLFRNGWFLRILWPKPYNGASNTQSNSCQVHKSLWISYNCEMVSNPHIFSANVAYLWSFLEDSPVAGTSDKVTS